MAAGAMLPPPDDGWQLGCTIPASDLGRLQKELRQRFAEQGLVVATTPNTDEWNETMQSWPMATSRAERDELNVSSLLWMSLGIVIHPGRWVEAQMNYSDSLLHA